VVKSGIFRSREESAMSTERVRRVFIYLVLGVATLLAVLEVRAARGGDPVLKQDTPWLPPLREMDKAIARGDLMSAAVARHETYRAAITSRTWEGYLAAGDAALRLGQATQNRGAAEPDARRLYLAALFRAGGQHSLDGVLQATEAFSRLGDRDVVVQGVSIARDLAGADPAAQARVGAVADRSSPEVVVAGAHGDTGL
jgi:hypothetical protein